jgi:hypothetical protein
MKKQIENLAQIPIQQQSWQGLSGAKDSVSLSEKNFLFYDQIFSLQDELHQTTITSQSTLIVRQIDTSSNQQIPTVKRHIKVNKNNLFEFFFLD